MDEGGGNAPTSPDRDLSELLGTGKDSGPSKKVMKKVEAKAGAQRLLAASDLSMARRLAWLAALAAVFAVAIIWRWHYASQTQIYTYDSYYYLVLGRNLRHGLSYSFTAGHPHFKFMPLYPLAIASFNLLGAGLEFAGKFLNVLFTAACVFPIYVIGSLLFHRRVGLAAAALFAFEPISTIWASVPMSEGLFTLLVCLGVCFAVCWLKKERSYWIYLAAAATGLAVVTRWEGVFLVALLGVFGIYYCFKGRIRWTQLVVGGAIALAPFAALMVRNWVAFGTPLKSAYLEELRSHIPELEIMGPGGRFIRYLLFGGITPLGESMHLYNYGYLVFGYAGLALGLFMRRFRAGSILLLAWIIFVGTSHFMWYFVSARFMFAATPAICLGAGFILGFPWVKDGRRRDRRWAIVFAYALAACMIAALAFASVPIIDDGFLRDMGRLEDDDGGLASREAMLWLRENAGDAGVASRIGPMGAFYLGRDVFFIGDWVFEPADLRLDQLVEDSREKGVRYIVLYAWSDNVYEALLNAGLDPSVKEELRLVKTFHYTSDKEDVLDTYGFVFEVPGSGGAPP